MALNEYDEALTEGAPLAANAVSDQMKNNTESNPYMDAMPSLQNEKAAELQRSFYVGVQKEPDRAAKVLELSNKLRVNTDFVDRNYDKLVKDNRVQNQNYDGFISNNPKTADWLINPDHTSIVHDEVESISKLEDHVNDYSRLSNSFRSLMSGSAGLMKGFAQLPGTLAELGIALPMNYVTSFLGPDAQVKIPEVLQNKEAVDYWNKQMEAWSPPAQQESFSDTFSKVSNAIDKGDYTRASGILFDSFSTKFLSNLPLMGMMAGGAIAGAPTAAAAFGGLFQSSQSLEEGHSKNLPPLNVEVNALTQGLAEMAFERMGTLQFLEEWSTKIASNYGKQVTTEVMKDFAKTMFAAPIIEGTEEGATQAVQNISDYINGVNPDALKTFVSDVAGASFLGSLSGGVFTGPSAIIAGRTRLHQIRQANLAKEFYLSFGESAEATKLRARLPESQKAFIDHITKDSPVENVYISPESFETYFQSKGINPVKAAQDIGIVSEYNLSKDTGQDIKVPLSTWANEIAPTEHYAALSDDIKFRSDDLSVNEAKAVEAQIQSDAEQAINSKTEVNQSVVDQSNKIKEIVKQQLIESGLHNQEADRISTLNSAFYTTMANRLGIQPEQLFKERGISFNNPDLPPISNETLQILDQSPLAMDQHDVYKIDPKTQNRIKVETFNSNAEAQAFVDKKGSKSKTKYEIVRTFFQDQKPPEARGQIRLGPNKFISIDLFKSSDLSTPIHELGHAYLEILSEASENADVSESLKNDSKAIREWLGAKEGEAFTREQHEQFARGFEAYVMEGKAPSNALRRAFAAFKIWLTHIYRMVKNLNVEISPEVRGVFNRMLATEEEIAAAEIQQNQNPLFGDPRSWGFSEEEAQKYIDVRNEAREIAESTLQERLMQDLKKEQSLLYKEKYAALKTQADFEVSQSPLYKALDLLKAKDPIDGVEPIKLLKEPVAGLIEKEIIKKLPRGIFSDEGVHPDVVAGLFGFNSGKEMLEQMAAAPKKSEAVDALVKARIEQDFPNLLGSPNISQEAMDAIHNDKQSELLRLELQHLASNKLSTLKGVIKKITRRVPTQLQIRQTANNLLAAKQLNEIGSYQFQLAERKAAKQAGEFLAQGNIEAAFDAKRRELLNHELYRAALNAKQDLASADKLFKKFSRKDEVLSKSHDMDLVNAGRSILASYGLGQSDGKSPKEYLQQLNQYDPEAYEAISRLINSVVEKPKLFSELTLNEFIDLRNSIDALWSLSSSTKQIEIDGKAFNRDDVIEKLSNRIFELNQKQASDEYRRSISEKEKRKIGFMGMVSALTRVENWVDFMDAGDPQGYFRQFIFTPISEAITGYRIKRKQFYDKFLQMLEPMRGELTNNPIKAHELGFEFSGMSQLLGMLLHTGNESNLNKLLGGYGWSKANFESFIQRMWSEKILQKKHYDFVQGIWDLFDQLKPDAQKVHKKQYGYFFNEITANKVITPFGEYKGGYAPAITDQFLVNDAFLRSEEEILKTMNNSFMFPTTGRGFTRSRVENYTQPLLMDIRLGLSHIDKVLRFIHIEPHIKDVGRVVFNRQFNSVLNNYDQSIASDLLKPWLQRSAQQKISTPLQGKGGRAIDTFFRELRTRTGMNVMIGSFTNAMQQITGLSISSIKVAPKFLRNALWDYVRSPSKISEFVNDKSDFMKTRTSHQTFEIMQNMEDILVDTSKFDKAIDFAKKHGYFLQQGTQNIVDNITWLGAYNEAIQKNADEVSAVRQADSAVRETQGSFNPEDISRFEAGNSITRLFTQFYSYFNMQANLLGSEGGKLLRDVGLKKGLGRALYLYMFGFMIPAFLNELLVRMMSGKFDQDDDDSYLDDFMTSFFAGQFNSGTALFPIVGPVVKSAYNSFNNKWYDDRISTSPAVSQLESAAKAPNSLYKSIFEDGSRKSAIRDTLTAISLFTGLPVAPLSRPLGYLSDLDEGKAEASGPIDFTRGLMTGKSGQ